LVSLESGSSPLSNDAISVSIRCIVWKIFAFKTTPLKNDTFQPDENELKHRWKCVQARRFKINCSKYATWYACFSPVDSDLFVAVSSLSQLSFSQNYFNPMLSNCQLKCMKSRFEAFSAIWLVWHCGYIYSWNKHTKQGH
jgi:hypothetical protein